MPHLMYSVLCNFQIFQQIFIEKKISARVCSEHAVVTEIDSWPPGAYVGGAKGADNKKTST